MASCSMKFRMRMQNIILQCPIGLGTKSVLPQGRHIRAYKVWLEVELNNNKIKHMFSLIKFPPSSPAASPLQLQDSVRAAGCKVYRLQ
jgi:hypothetical protein